MYTVNFNDSSSCDSQLLSQAWTNISVNNDSCSSTAYTGSICLPYLQAWQSCVTTSGGEATPTTVTITKMSTEQEDTLNTINGILGMYMCTIFNITHLYSFVTYVDLYASTYPQCRSEALPFLCQFSFPLINCDTRQAYQSSKEECIRISTTICSVLWEAAANLGYADNLPICEDLPEGTLYIN